MDYIQKWKDKELEGYKVALENWKKHLEELNEEEKAAKEEYEAAKNKYREEHDELPAVEKGKYLDADLEEVYAKYVRAKDKYFDYLWNANRFFYEHGRSRDFEERCKKEIDKHFNQLQAKVEKKIGKIIKIESFGGDDYAFEGENGTCMVEVIWAGGYNIQRLHTRWIVKNI